MSQVRTTLRASVPADSGALGLSEQTVKEIVSRFHNAYDARDIDTLVELFAENGDWQLGPGTFTGKAAIRRLLEWDARLSPSARCNESGVGVIVYGNVAVSERVIEETFEPPTTCRAPDPMASTCASCWRAPATPCLPT